MDESLSEPPYCRRGFPNLLLNGSEGIAVGMATKIPPHNLNEVVDATIAVLRDPEIDIEDCSDRKRAGTFPRAALSVAAKKLRSLIAPVAAFSRCGPGLSIDRVGRGSHERDAVIITELPFQVNKAKLIERIAELANEKKLEGIAEVRDESDRHGMRIVVLS